jgi:acetyl-CoA carboxylase biotin carboxyl carrier protein
MSLTAAEVAEIMRLVEQTGFDELTLEIDGTKVTLRRGFAPEAAVDTNRPATAVPKTPPSGGLPPPAAEAVIPAAAERNVHVVPAPLFGTFYRAPKPGAPPFVEVGGEVADDTVVGIIEVMKLMNTVRAGVRGTVVEIMMADGALAEYGAPLLRVRKAG